MKNVLLFGIIFLLFIHVVVAIPPFTQTSTQSLGLSILYPKQLEFAVGEDFDLYFHVFNTTGYLLPFNKANCTIHIYDTQGNHIVNKSLTSGQNGQEFEYAANLSLFPIGYYSYNLWCNATSGAGYASEYFYITGDGQETISSDTYVMIIIILIPLILIFAFLYWASQLGEDHTALKMLLQLMIIPLSFITLQLAILTVMKFYVWSSMAVVLSDVSMYMGYFAWIIGFYILIYIIYKAFMHFKFKKEQDNEEIDYEV